SGKTRGINTRLSERQSGNPIAGLRTESTRHDLPESPRGWSQISALVGTQSFNNFETTASYPCSPCATPILHTTKCGFGRKITALEDRHVDEVMRHLQGPIEEAEVKRFRALSMRVGVAGPDRSKADGDFVNRWENLLEKEGRTAVAKVIEFY